MDMVSRLTNLPFKNIFRCTVRSVKKSAMNEKQQKNAQPFTIFVEGNIGSGKTTFLNHFSNSDAHLFSEPVNYWRDARGHNLLGLMYENPSRWGMTFQSYVQLTMLKTHLYPTSKHVKIMERSLFSARYCFVENLHKQGLMSDSEYVVLDEWFNWIVSEMAVGGDLIVYLQTEPEVVYERVRTRSRKEENSVSLDYLRQLHELHEDWLRRSGKFSSKIPIIVLNANQNMAEMEKEFKKCKSEIEKRIRRRESPVLGPTEGQCS